MDFFFEERQLDVYINQIKLNCMLIPTLLSVLVTIKGMSTNDQGVDTSSVWNLLEVCFSNMWLKSTGNVLF